MIDSLLPSKEESWAAMDHTSSTMTLGIDDYVERQKSLGAAVFANTEAIAALGTNFKMIEQQVKSIARVMAQHNIGRMKEERTDALAVFKLDLTNHFSDKWVDITQRLDKEAERAASKRSEIISKIRTSEEKFIERLDQLHVEQAKAFAGLEQKIANLDTRFQSLDVTVKDSKQQGTLYVDAKFAEASKLIGSIQTHIVAERSRAERASSEAEQERNRHRENLKETNSQLNQELSKHVKLLQQHFSEKWLSVQSEVQQMLRRGDDPTDSLLTHCEAMVTQAKDEIERAIRIRDSALDCKVVVVGRQVMELKKILDRDRVTRDSDSAELRMTIMEEKRNREIDEARLFRMVENCMSNLDKLHRF